MFSNGTGSPAAIQRAKSLIDAAKQQSRCDQSTAIELQQIMDSLVEELDVVSSDRQRTEVILLLCTEMLDSQNVCQLCECGVKAAFAVLSKVLPGTADTESPDTAVFRARTIELCLDRTFKLYEILSSQLETASGSTSSADTPKVADAVQLAVHIADSMRLLLSSLPSVIASQQIWSSGQSGTSPLAVTLVKWFEISCCLSKTSLTQAMRKTSALAPGSAALAKSAGSLIELVSSSLSTDSHLSQDLGMKRAALERFSEHVLAAYKLFLSQPQQFKAIWKALCRIATRFTSASFAAAKLCVRVFAESCAMISVLSQQTAGTLAKSSDKDLGQRAVAHRIMNSLAFVRFFMFHMSALLKRMYSDPSIDDTAVFRYAMPMFDDVLGCLVTPHNMAFMPVSITDNMQSLVLAVAEKVVVAMFSHNPALLVSYIGSLRSLAMNGGSRCSQLPLLSGLERPAANIEILRMVLVNFDSFSGQQQIQLLARHKSLVSALAMAVDRDPTSILPAAGSNRTNVRSNSPTAYEQLVSSMATSATKLASPDVFELWEIAMFDVLSQTPPGGLSACIAADAWIVVAHNVLMPALVLSTMDGIIDIACSAPESISDVARSRFATLFSGFAQSIGRDELTAWLARLVTRFDSQAVGVDLVYATVPWSAFTDSSAVPAVRKAVQQIKSTPGSAAILAATGLVLAAKELGIDEVGQTLCASANQLLRQSLDTPSDSGTVGSILAMAVILAQGDLAFSASILDACFAHISAREGRVFASSPSSAVLLALLCGCFAEADLEQPLLLPVGKTVSQVFAFLLHPSRPWMVRHYAHRQLLRFAMDEQNAHIVEAVASGNTEHTLLQFIQKAPAGKQVADGKQGTVYRSVFDIGLPKEMASCTDINGILEAISSLRRELAAADDMSLDNNDALVLRSELGRLSGDIARML